MFRRVQDPNVEMLKVTKKTVHILYAILSITSSIFPATFAARKAHLTEDVIHSMIHSKSGQQPRGYAHQFIQLCHLHRKLSKPLPPNYAFLCSTTLSTTTPPPTTTSSPTTTPPPTIPPSTVLAHLINGHGKCMDASGDLEDDGEGLIQFDCDPEETGQMWSWNNDTLGSGDQHICNGFDKCATSPDEDSNLTSLIQSDFVDDEPGQTFHFLNSSRPGFFMIEDDFGNCIGVDEDSKDNGTAIVADTCDTSQDGQYWKWLKI